MNPGVGLTDSDRTALSYMAGHRTPDDPAKGGRKRWEGRCRSCDAELESGETCPFCGPTLTRPDFEDGDEAAREFLHRMGVDPDG